MNKTELIAEVAKKCSLPKKDAEKAVNATFDAITEALCNGDKVRRLRDEVPRGAHGPQPQDQGSH